MLLTAAAIGGVYAYTHRESAQKSKKPLDAPIPVTAIAVAARDVPIYLDGIGTVQASANVTIKPQIDGQLIAVNFTEGQEVEAGTVLAQIDPRYYQAALDQALAKKAQDEANLANARIDLARYAKLAANAYTSAQQADTQRATVGQLVAQVAGDQAQIDTARVNLSFTNIVSPVAGRVGIRLVDRGNIVHAGDTTGICVIATLRPIYVMFTLPQQNLPLAARAMKAGHAEVLALPQDNDRALSTANLIDRGELLVIDNQVDSATGTIKLKASFPNRDLVLWPGGFVNVKLKVETLSNALTIPPAAVQRGPSGLYVFVVQADGTAKRRTVTITHQDLDTAIVATGLEAGENVVTDGTSRLSDGTKVVVSGK
jgi:multidrug efflux system membrane fusion protein